MTNVPSDIDILIAGFSCVDFSRLNKNGKKLTDAGESSETFRAVLGYARKYRPAVVIIENIDSAPWDLLKGIFENDRPAVHDWFRTRFKKPEEVEEECNSWLNENDVGYSAAWLKVDAKNYYMPHTRARRYMICLDRHRYSSVQEADDATQDWKSHMVALEQKASVTVEAFLLPDDDPRLQRAKDEMSKIGKPRKSTDWELCNGRHERYRRDNELGTGRPILNWTNDGAAKPCSYIWTEWVLSQVERVWDSIEISFLRNARKGMDSFFKS